MRDGRVVLRSQSLGREVIPRLTTAHNFVDGALGVYRFLASLQSQDLRPLVLPHRAARRAAVRAALRIGRVVLREASWTLRKAELEPVTGGDRRRAHAGAARGCAPAARLPRWVCVEDGDNVLPVDLDNVLAVDSFAQLVKQRGPA